MSITRHASLVCSAALASWLGSASRAAATPNEPVLAIDCGATAASAWFAADGSFSGGSTLATSNAIDTSQAYYPAPAAIYQTARQGASTYTLSGLTANARYQVRLHFADPVSTAAGQRTFNVSIGGTTVLSSYDIFADIGHNNAVVKPFNATANASGQIVVAFTNVTGSALISAIDVLPGAAYFINAGYTVMMLGAYQTDQFSSDGNVFTSGTLVNTSLVHGAPPSVVYQSERYNLNGSVTYTLPNLVVGQRYDVRLHFAEIDPNHNYVGARKFNVKLNGTRVLFEYDPFDAGGGLNVATARVFEAVANSSGQIVILFERVASDPKISAIEVRPQISFKFNAGGAAASGFDKDRSGYLVPSATGTSTVTTTQTITLTQGTPPIPYAPAAVYQSARVLASTSSSMTYALAGLVPDKMYHVRLHFAEIDSTKQAVGARVFNVKINGHRVLPKLDVFAAAGGGYRGLVKELTYSADGAGRLSVTFEKVTGGALINGIEVDREPPAAGYFANDVGVQNRFGGGFIASTAFGYDGGCSALVGSNVLWAYGDTLFVDPSTTPPSNRAWTNTGALGSTRDLTNVLEVTDGNGAPSNQFVPMLSRQLAYNQTHQSGFGCTGTCDGTYYAIWPGSIVRQSDGSGLVFAGVGMIFGTVSSPKSEGVITYVQAAGAWPSNPTLPPSVTTQNTLFPFQERLFTRGFVSNESTPYVYLYRSEAGPMASLRTALTAGTATASLALATSGLKDAAVKGQQLELLYVDSSQVSHRQIVNVATSVGPGPDSNAAVSVTSFKPNYSFPVNTIVQHVLSPVGQLGAALSAGVARTTVPFANPLPVALKSGQTFELWANDSSGVQRVQVVTATANAAAGATSITVSSFTPSIAYPANTPVHQSMSNWPLWNMTYIARAPLASAATRSAYTFFNQKLNNYAGGWDTNIGNNTPQLYTDGSIGWMDAPSVAWNPYLGKYLIVRAVQINDGVYVSTSSTPQGPWTPETLVTKVHTHESYAGAYFMNQHPEAALGNGQTIFVSYAASGPGPSDYTGGVRVIRITLP